MSHSRIDNSTCYLADLTASDAALNLQHAMTSISLVWKSCWWSSLRPNSGEYEQNGHQYRALTQSDGHITSSTIVESTKSREDCLSKTYTGIRRSPQLNAHYSSYIPRSHTFTLKWVASLTYLWRSTLPDCNFFLPIATETWLRQSSPSNQRQRLY